MLFSPSVFIDCYCCFHARNIHDSSKEVKHFLQISLKYLTQTRHLKSCVYLTQNAELFVLTSCWPIGQVYASPFQWARFASGFITAHPDNAIARTANRTLI